MQTSYSANNAIFNDIEVNEFCYLDFDRFVEIIKGLFAVCDSVSQTYSSCFVSANK